MPDYYEVLGVRPDASDEEIKSKYRELVKMYHPDKHANNPLQSLAEQKMKEINEAYEVLGSPEKRRQYDGGNVGGASSRYSSSTAGSYEALIAQANGDLSQRLWERAVQLCTKAIGMNPSRYEAYAIRGMARYQQNNHNNAIEDLNAAISRGGREEAIYAYLAFSSAELGRHGEAISAINKAIEMGGRNPNYLAFLAIQYETIGRSEEARAAWDEVRRIDPNNEMLRRRDQAWRVGGTYIDKKDAGTAAACATCVLLDLLFNCC